MQFIWTRNICVIFTPFSPLNSIFSIEILIKLHKSLFFCICNMIVTSDVHMTHSNHTLNRWQRSLHATHLHHVWVETLHFRTAFSPLYIYIWVFRYFISNVDTLVLFISNENAIQSHVCLYSLYHAYVDDYGPLLKCFRIAFVTANHHRFLF